MHTSKNAIISLCIILMIFNIVGCNKVEVNESNGRFIQEEYALPDVIRIYDFNKIKDDSIVMLAQSSEKLFEIYMSQDGGKSWEKKDFSLPDENIDDKLVINAAVSGDNKVAIIYSDTKKEDEINDSNTHAKILNSDKEEIEVKLNEIEKIGITKLSFESDGDLICLGENTGISQFDGNTGELKYNYLEYKVCDFSSISDKLLMVTNDTVVEYNLGTGKKNTTLDSIKEYMTMNFKVYPSEEKDTFYFSNTDGLYKYNVKNDEINMVINGTTNGFSDNSLMIVSLLKNDEHNYLAIQYNFTDKVYKLISYSYMEVDKSKEVVIYSLYKSQVIGQAISNFEKTNREIFIKYEIGITDSSGITESDAIRSLNTEIMSGKGPDILLMDNISTDSYIKKGLLEDISDVINSKKGKLFDNILDSYMADDGGYTVPLRFQIPIIMGEEKYINSVNNIDSLANKIEDINKSDSGNVLEVYNPEDIVNILYNTNAGTWVNKDNTCNKENIRIYLEDCKRIYTITEKTTNKEGYKYNLENIQNFKGGDKYEYSINRYLNRYVDPVPLIIKNKFKFSIGNIQSLNQLSEITSVLNYDKNLCYKTFSDKEETVFIPTEIVAINAKSNKKDFAKEFISALLDEYLQSTNFTKGLPVNKSALNNKFKTYTEGSKLGENKIEFNDGGFIEYNRNWITQNDMNNLLENIETLKSPSKYNSTYLYDVNKEAANYISGKSSLDDTVDKIASKIQLSLAEK